MQLLCEAFDVIRRNRNKPTNTFTVAMELSSSTNRLFTDEDALILAEEIKQRLSGSDGDRIQVINDMRPSVRDDVVPSTSWFTEHVFPEVGIEVSGYILRHGAGQHDLPRTIERLNTLHKFRQRWMFAKWVAYLLTGLVVGGWAFAQLLQMIVKVFF